MTSEIDRTFATSTDLREIGRKMLVSRDASETARLLSDAVQRWMNARRAAVFLRIPESGELVAAVQDTDPALLPEREVVEFAFRASTPPLLPHEGLFLAVFPLRVRDQRVGVLSVDVTGVAEEVPGMKLEPVEAFLEQGAAALWNTRLIERSQKESMLLASILESITNGIITVDSEGRITRLNRNAMAMLELAPDCLGQRYRDVLAPDVVAALDDLIRETTEAGFAMEKVVSRKLSQGPEIPLAVSTSALTDENYRILGMLLIFRDMTATRELDRLRQLDQMKSEFVANVSHELKTPLTSIKAYTEACKDMTEDAQMKEFLNVVDEESDRLLFLINDLLNVSQIQSGKMKMHFARCDPKSVLTDILHISKVQSEKHEIVPELAEGLPEMLLDKEKMKEVMINLLSNAIKYSPNGGHVWVRMAREESNLRIEVQDEGIGMAKENIPQLFQAFYRVDASATTQVPGTGLGLVIVKAIVEKHGGKIWVESELGKGTTFCLLIPIQHEALETPQGFAE